MERPVKSEIKRLWAARQWFGGAVLGAVRSCEAHMCAVGDDYKVLCNGLTTAQPHYAFFTVHACHLGSQPDVDGRPDLAILARACGEMPELPVQVDAMKGQGAVPKQIGHVCILLSLQDGRGVVRQSHPQ